MGITVRLVRLAAKRGTPIGGLKSRSFFLHHREQLIETPTTRKDATRNFSEASLI